MSSHWPADRLVGEKRVLNQVMEVSSASAAGGSSAAGAIAAIESMENICWPPTANARLAPPPQNFTNRSVIVALLGKITTTRLRCLVSSLTRLKSLVLHSLRQCLKCKLRNSSPFYRAEVMSSAAMGNLEVSMAAT